MDAILEELLLDSEAILRLIPMPAPKLTMLAFFPTVRDAGRAEEQLRAAAEAQAAGALPMPAVVGQLMRGAARIMTATAHRI